VATDNRRRRFEVEALAASALSHPNVLAVFDFGVHGDMPYLVAELLEGSTLKRELGRGPLPARRCVDYAAQVAHGLGAIHDKAIVHRDLKPSNLFVTLDGRVKIIDFGLAKMGAEDASLEWDRGDPTTTPDDAPTRPGALLGTAPYMSPEQVQGLPVDHRSDIFALGVVIWEMLTGWNAFRADTHVETMYAILRMDVPNLPRAAGPLAPALEHLLRRCLAKRRDERFQSAKDLAFALESIVAPPAWASGPEGRDLGFGLGSDSLRTPRGRTPSGLYRV
jgi:serine/threonine protein kinase